MKTQMTTTTPAENITMLSRLRTTASKTPAASMHTSTLLDSCVSVGRPGADTPNTYFHTESKSNYNQHHQQSTSLLLTPTCNFITAMLDVSHPWYVGSYVAAQVFGSNRTGGVYKISPRNTVSAVRKWKGLHHPLRQFYVFYCMSFHQCLTFCLNLWESYRTEELFSATTNETSQTTASTMRPEHL